jgi:putative nucleotidyltransferase with HDIG domain
MQDVAKWEPPPTRFRPAKRNACNRFEWIGPYAATTGGAGHGFRLDDRAEGIRKWIPAEAMMPTTNLAMEPLDALIESARAAEREGAWDDALEHYEAAFAAAVAERDVPHIAELLRWIGTVHREKGHLDPALELYEASHAVAEANGLNDQLASVLNCLAIVAQLRGEQDRAETLYRSARRLAVVVRDDRLIAMIDQNLGSLANIRGDIRTAISRYRLALDCYRLVGDQARAIGALNNMGMAHMDLGQFPSAEDCFNQALGLARETGDALTLAYLQVNRGELHVKRQQYEQARECCDEGFCIFARLESAAGQAEAHKLYGVIYREIARPRLADIHLGLALNLAVTAQNLLLQAKVVHETGRLYIEERRHREAIKRLNEARTLFQQVQAPRDVLEVAAQLTDLKASYLRVAHQWSVEAIDVKDPHTRGHSARVAGYADALSALAGFDADQRTWLRVGALLHDVGKSVLPWEILGKPGPLSAAEWEVMTRHTVLGDEIVADLGLPAEVRSLVRSHHERWDGRGYPDRLMGEEIPLHVRIVTVADVFDALISPRSYRPAYSQADARRILREEAGRALDPRLARLFSEHVLPARKAVLP